MECRKCGQPSKQLYQVSVAPKLNAKFCSECCNKWFDSRDKAIEELFRDYLVVPKPVSKSK